MNALEPQIATLSGPTRAARATRIVCALALLAATAWVYGRVAELGFVDFDDPKYVSQNPSVLGGLSAAGWRYAFTSTELGNWHPLTWLSHMFVAQCFGANAAAHHLANLALHALDVLLVFAFFARATQRLPESFVIAGWFAVHPLHVESVAWVAERKDVLSTAFGLLALIAWVEWTRRGGRVLYALALAAFAAGLMSKPMLVTWPVLLVLLDFWPLDRAGRFGLARRLAEKWPFFALAALSVAVTWLAQRAHGAMEFGERIAFAERAANAVRSIGVYLVQTVWPRDLAIYYAYPVAISAAEVAGAALAVAAISAAVFALRRRARELAFGWAWYLISLLPVLGLVQVGGQAHADRYTYVPHIGLFAAIVFGASRVLHSANSRRFAFACALATIAALSVVAREQVATWRDEQSVFAQAVAATVGNSLAQDHYAQALQEHGDLGGAIEHFREVVRLVPDRAEPHVNLGLALELHGELADAEREFIEATRLDPRSAYAWADLAALQSKSKRFDDAASSMERALAIEPTNGGFLVSAATNDLQRGARALAALRFKTAVARDPNWRVCAQAQRFAWMFAADPDPKARDASLALEIVDALSAVRGGDGPLLLETRAAANAELGRFEAAEKLASRALEIAIGAQFAAARERLERALAGYRRREPFRDAGE